MHGLRCFKRRCGDGRSTPWIPCRRSAKTDAKQDIARKGDIVVDYCLSGSSRNNHWASRSSSATPLLRNLSSAASTYGAPVRRGRFRRAGRLGGRAKIRLEIAAIAARMPSRSRLVEAYQANGAEAARTCYSTTFVQLLHRDKS